MTTSVERGTAAFRTAALAGLVVLVAAACAGRRGDQQLASDQTSPCAPPAGSAELAEPGETSVPSEAIESAWAELSSGWTALPSPPFVRARAVSVWTGAELVHWGGDSNYAGTHHSDGAAYDPLSQTWRQLAPSPLVGRSTAGAVWSGSEVFIWGGWGSRDKPTGDGAAYDPATDSWRRLPDAPLSPRVPVAVVWTGEEMIVWGGVGESRLETFSDGASYVPAGNCWRKLAPAPIELNEATAIWTGKEMLVYGALLDNNNASSTEYAQGVAYDPSADRWRVIAASTLSPQASSVEWTGDRALVWDYLRSAALYEPASDTWETLPPFPGRDLECYPHSARTGGVILAWYCGQGALFHVGKGTWEEILRPPGHVMGRPLSAGTVLLFAGASHEGCCNRLWAFKV